MPAPRRIARQVSATTRGVEAAGNVALSPKAFKSSVFGGELIGYVARTLRDAEQRNVLTPTQANLYNLLVGERLERRILRRLATLTPATSKAATEAYARTPAAQLDAQLQKAFEAKALDISRQLQVAHTNGKGLRLATAFGSMELSRETVAAVLGASTTPPTPSTDAYDFELSYRGITTRDTGDRCGGVEPYMVASFYRVPDDGSSMQPFREPFVIEQKPWGLGDMDADEWMPSGGTQDGQGNPRNPIAIFAGAFPPFPLDSLYIAMVRVMEKDGGQGAEIASLIGKAMLSIGGSVLVAGLGSGNPGLVIAGAVIAALGLVSELVSLCFASDDDYVGDIVMAFGKPDLIANTFYERADQVKYGGNKWVLYFGVSSIKTG